MTAAGYVRLSKLATGSNLSLAGMTRDVQTLAERLGEDLVSLHVDDGLSGAIRERPAFLTWLSSDVDVLLAFSVDRMTREGLNVAALILDRVEGKQYGKACRLVDCTGLDSLHGETFRFMFVIKAEIARAEREVMRQRNRDKTRRGHELGLYVGGPVPYGFRVLDRRLVPAEAEQHAIQWMARRVIEGDSLRSIANALNKTGVKPRRAPGWSGWNVRALLLKDGAVHLVEPEMLLVARQALALKSYARPTGRPGGHLMSKILRCGTCGSPMQASVDSYRCNLTWCSKRVAVSIARTDEYFTARFLAIAGRVPTFTESVDIGTGQLKALQADLTAAKARLVDLLTDQALEAVRGAQRALEAYEATPKLTDLIRTYTGRTMGEEWESASVTERNAFLRSWLDHVTVLPGRRSVHGLDPDRFDIVTSDEIM